MVSMSCLTGYFGYPEAWTASLAEVLLRADEKGAAAALMPTGMTTTAGQHVMNTALFESLFAEDVRTLGPAIAAAKQQLLANGDAYFEQISATFLLFGDPAMQLKVPLPRRPVGLTGAFRSQGGVELSWQAATDCNGKAVAGYNVYRSTSAAGVFAKLNGSIIAQTRYIDATARAAAVSSSTAVAAVTAPTYYYAVTSVDADGDESIQSAMVSPSPAQTISPNPAETGSGSPSSEELTCFISTAESPSGSAGVCVALVLAILGVVLIWVQRLGLRAPRCASTSRVQRLVRLWRIQG
jgi:hypothetical protein